MSTALYLVPTPIGNLEDITLRALNVLKSVDVILAEDTRTSGVLLRHYDIHQPLYSYHIHNEHQTVERWIARMQDGETLALITDAGTPGISDPGFLLVRAALEADLKLECLPGATAFVPALVKSGLPADKFVFEGFLPHKKGRQTRIQLLLEEPRTCILYESPHRVVKLLEQLKELGVGERRVSVSRELTKLYEETVTGTVDELITHFGEGKVKGEIVVVLEGSGRG
ncbi:MAG TPA: 16S rRNA (cytidine(1402)-2'-O)-methyltransferase [Cytophagales bacterium]|nr:16S rRNA (cytidine(1402)-2'-O)-methyltransferase [Cytophagales bacterium]